MKSHGFSLMELIIVIAIISILVAIALPSYQIYVRKAHYTEIVQAAIPYRVGIEECFEITGTLDECTAGKNGVPPAILHGDNPGLVDTIEVINNGKIIITPLAKYGITPKDTFTLTPHMLKDKLIWHDGGGGVAAGYAN